MNRISTRHLKWLTALFIVIPILLMLSGPWVLRRGKHTTKLAYANRIGAFGAALSLSTLGAGIGAYVILRRQQQEYREQALENMRTLLDSVREDRLAKARKVAASSAIDFTFDSDDEADSHEE